MRLNPDLLHASASDNSVGNFPATIEANGLYNTFQFVLRLSPSIHRKLSEAPTGIVSNQAVGFDGAQAFSTLLHETIHWWQHIGSTYGFMLSLTYPTQMHANYNFLRNIISKFGFQKSIVEIARSLTGPNAIDNLGGISNIIVNNHFDIAAFRYLTHSPKSAETIVKKPQFESVGHSYHLTYANNLLTLAATADPDFKAFQNPEEWDTAFDTLRTSNAVGFYYGSPVELWPIGAREIFEGQACFAQMQYLAYASGGKLELDDFKNLGMLHGVYEAAFLVFLTATGLTRPSSVIHPTVGLFLLICDMALNPGVGFTHPIFPNEHSFITDLDPGTRFFTLAKIVQLKCRSSATAVQKYSRDEYISVTEELAHHALIASPLDVARKCNGWVQPNSPLHSLMKEYESYKFEAKNFPIRLLLSHFLAFNNDKLRTPEFFCWPGSWMAGSNTSELAMDLFDRHGALFIDKEDDDGIFPRISKHRDDVLVQKAFQDFYGANVVYDMTDQWITQPGPFQYRYRWLSQNGKFEELKDFADRNFEMAYSVKPDDADIQSP